MCKVPVRYFFAEAQLRVNVLVSALLERLGPGGRRDVHPVADVTPEAAGKDAQILFVRWPLVISTLRELRLVALVLQLVKLLLFGLLCRLIGSLKQEKSLRGSGRLFKT